MSVCTTDLLYIRVQPLYVYTLVCKCMCTHIHVWIHIERAICRFKKETLTL